jgi:hypothetical protein
MTDRLSRAEILKDAAQELIESGAATVGEVASIITGAVKEVAGAVGGFATDAFEIRDGMRNAANAPDREGDDE